MFDLILHGGSIVDGSGTRAFRADVAIKGDSIVRIGDCADSDAQLRLDCTGLIVAPGFIDMHGHSDEVLLALPTADSKIRQGITTEVGGNCGSSPGPLAPAMLERRRAELTLHYGLDTSFRSLGGFLDQLERSRCALNFCCFAGVGNTRAACGAVRPQRLDARALDRQCALVKEACAEGAIGVSSGLIYQPGSFADSAELCALAAAAAAAGSPLYASHIRSEGDRLDEAVEEALEIGRRSGAAVQLSHHKAAGRRNWGKVHGTLQSVERARAAGVDVVLDQYPYTASNTSLSVILPADVNVGTPQEVAARLADAGYRARVAARVEADYAGRWESVIVSTVAHAANASCEGMSLAAIASARGTAPADAALELLAAERLDVSAIYFTMCEADVRTVLSYAHTCIGSDASARAVSGATARGRPHPRAYGTFPRIFGRYVRETGLLTLEEAVRKATSLPAARLGLHRRGVLQAGWYADIVVFDASCVNDKATYEQPHQYPQGVPHVIVNGVVVVRDDHITKALPGRVLRRGRDL